MAKSAIEWTDYTWNPMRGCSAVSPGCTHCYAAGSARGLAKKHYEGLTRESGKGPQWTGEVRLVPHKLDELLHVKRPQRVFVNSMSDTFHEQIPEDYIRKVFEKMGEAHWHVFQVLTKREERLLELAPRLPWPDNVWVAVSVENADYLHRIDRLRVVPAHGRFLSLEPLLGPLPNLDLTDIHWVIAGGESGSRSRPMEADWVRDIRDQCAEANVPFFFKQWGGVNKKKTGRTLDGRVHNGMPRAMERIAKRT